MAVSLKIVSQVVASGQPGPAGKSAYQIAVDNGFEGTESEWLKELHPFKGWFDSVSELEEEHSAPSVGEYAYVKGATSSDPVKIYECSTEGSWSDSGRTVDTSTVQTFRSGEAVNDVDITDDSSDIEKNSDKIPTAGAVADALDNVEFSTGEKVKNIGIDDEPTAGSDNLVKSSGVFKNQLDFLNNLLIAPNKFIDSTGTEINADGWNHTGKIYLNKIPDVWINGITIYSGILHYSSIYSIYPALFFDSDNNVIGHYYSQHETGDIYPGETIPASSIPEGTEYAMFNSSSSRLLFVNYGQEYFYEKIKSENQSISTLNTKVRTIEDSVGLSSKSVEIATGNNYIAYDFIIEGNTILVENSSGGVITIYYSDAQNQAHEVVGYIAQGNTGKFLLQYTYPKLYFYTTGTGGTVKVTLYGTSQKVDELNKSIKETNYNIQSKIQQNATNLIDETKLTLNKGIYASNGAVADNNDLCITDYIPVNGQSIITSAFFNTYWGGAVYDMDKKILRVLSTTQYTYQSGDYYIRLSYFKSSTSKRANYGTTLNSYKTYNPIDGYLIETNNKISAVDGKIVEVEDTLGTNVSTFTINVGNTYYTTDILKAGNDIEVCAYGLTTNGVSIYTMDENNQIVESGWFIPKDGTSIKIHLYYDAAKLYCYYAGASAVSGSIRHCGLEDDVEALSKDYFDVANGNFSNYVIGDSNNWYVPSRRIATPINNQSLEHQPENVVAINHDDLGASDYMGTRKIYNKFGFKANFNFILKPFADIKEKDRMCENVRAMIKDGHQLGLHAIMNNSYWINNKLIDITPDGTHTFAPRLDEIKGSNPDGTGINAFGQTITTTTTFGSLTGFGGHQSFQGISSALSNTKVVEATEANWETILKTYTRYFNKVSSSGLDLDGNVVTKTHLQWLEYWYNKLVDSTLGYSSEQADIFDMFAEDYDTGNGVGSYPDATHLLNGKIVFYDDTTNPNYNNLDYQKVGRFTKGLFKGKASCCNYEVIECSIAVAEAFCRHYFGMVKFTNYGKHGIGYMVESWEENGIPYDNREKTVFTNYNGVVYNTSAHKFETPYSILLDRGIKMTSYGFPESPIIFGGQRGLYAGMKDIRGTFFNYADQISFLCSITNSSSESYGVMTPAVLNSIIKDHKNELIKWFYENAGASVTVNGTTYYIKSDLKNTIDNIRGLRYTGKIPHISLDTISQYPNTMLAIHLLAEFCYNNDISIVPLETARLIACKERKVDGNLFPNPSFIQTLLNNFGGNSTSKEAYLPDGWQVDTPNINTGFSAATETIDNKNLRTFTISPANTTACRTYVYGLRPGKYLFTAKIKSESNLSAALRINFIKCSTKLDNVVGPQIAYFDSSTTYTDVTQEIVIPDFVKNYNQNTDVSKFCDGYEDNVVAIAFTLGMSTGVEVTLCNPKLKFIE